MNYEIGLIKTTLPMMMLLLLLNNDEDEGDDDDYNASCSDAVCNADNKIVVMWTLVSDDMGGDGVDGG